MQTSEFIRRMLDSRSEVTNFITSLAGDVDKTSLVNFVYAKLR
jgi:hypothetical protein